MQLHLKTTAAAPVRPAHLTAFVTARLTNDYVAIIWGRVPGMAGAVIQDIYAAREMRTLTSMVVARGLSAGEFVRYGRNMVAQ